MHTKSDWLRRICEVPEDEQVRLVFADWLEENGEPDRAAFIRLQIELDKAGCGRHALEGLEEFHDTLMLERKLFRYGDVRALPIAIDKSFFQGWSSILPDQQAEEIKDLQYGQFRIRLEWEKGFLHNVSMPCYSFMANCECLFREHPIQKVTLTDLTCDEISGPTRTLFRIMGGFRPYVGLVHIPDELLSYHASSKNKTLLLTKRYAFFAYNKQDLMKWLSGIAVNYGRSLVGLSSLPYIALPNMETMNAY